MAPYFASTDAAAEFLKIMRVFSGWLYIYIPRHHAAIFSRYCCSFDAIKVRNNILGTLSTFRAKYYRLCTMSKRNGHLWRRSSTAYATGRTTHQPRNHSQKLADIMSVVQQSRMKDHRHFAMYNPCLIRFCHYNSKCQFPSEEFPAVRCFHTSYSSMSSYRKCSPYKKVSSA